MLRPCNGLTSIPDLPVWAGRLSRFLFNCIERAGPVAGHAPRADIQIDLGQFLLFPFDCVHRTLLGAKTTPLAFLWIDPEFQQRLAALRPAALVVNMLFILMAEITQRREHRIWGSLTKTTE